MQLFPKFNNHINGRAAMLQGITQKLFSQKLSNFERAVFRYHRCIKSNKKRFFDLRVNADFRKTGHIYNPSPSPSPSLITSGQAWAQPIDLLASLGKT